MFKGSYCKLVMAEGKLKFQDPLRIYVQPLDKKDVLRKQLEVLLDEELNRVEELQKALAALDAVPAPAAHTVQPKRYPPGASGVKKETA